MTRGPLPTRGAVLKAKLGRLLRRRRLACHDPVQHGALGEIALPIPGVGPVLAQRILDARGSLGGFKSVTDLRKVDGIGDSRYEQLKDLVTV